MARGPAKKRRRESSPPAAGAASGGRKLLTGEHVEVSAICTDRAVITDEAHRIAAEGGWFAGGWAGCLGFAMLKVAARDQGRDQAIFGLISIPSIGHRMVANASGWLVVRSSMFLLICGEVGA
jgi:hypothetical protein